MFLITGSRSVYALDGDDFRPVWSPDWGIYKDQIDHFYGCTNYKDGWAVATYQEDKTSIWFLNKDFQISDVLVTFRAWNTHDIIARDDLLFLTHTGQDRLAAFRDKKFEGYIDWIGSGWDYRHLNSLCWGEETSETFSLWVIENKNDFQNTNHGAIVKILFNKHDIRKSMIEKRFQLSYSSLHSLSIRGDEIYMVCSDRCEILTINKHSGEVTNVFHVPIEESAKSWLTCCYHDEDRIIVGGGTRAERGKRHQEVAKLLILDKDYNKIRQWDCPRQGLFYQITNVRSDASQPL